MPLFKPKDYKRSVLQVVTWKILKASENSTAIMSLYQSLKVFIEENEFLTKF